MTSTKISKCRFCNNNTLIPCIDLGNQYLSSVFPSNLSYHNSMQKQLLDLVMCEKREDTCGLLQLGHSLDISKMYEEYPFTSSTNSSMPKILKDVLDSALEYITLKENDLVLDIGGNDGTLLSFLKDRNCDLLCIDAAKNIKPVFSSDKFRVINDFFSERIYKSTTKKKAKLIFSIAMFYHLSNPIQFARDIVACLADDGIWVIQMVYLPAMIKTTMYDNIVHEHVGYYGADHLRWIMEKVGLKIFDVTLNDVYGGSFRIFIKKRGSTKYASTERYRKILQDEVEMRIYDVATYIKFMERVKKTRIDLLGLCRKIRSQGKKIWVYGASTKGNTILQYCGITNDLIEAAADSNPFKFGKYIIGADIPIKSEDEMRMVKPDYLLVLPYSFVDAFIRRESELIKKGTKFIIPLPDVGVIS